MMRIEKSVGNQAANQVHDLWTVQHLLRSISHKLHDDYFTAPPISHGGIRSADLSKTASAIQDFQKEILGAKNPDGRVDPHGATFFALDALFRSDLEKLFDEADGYELQEELRTRVLRLIAHVGPAAVTSTLRSVDKQAEIMSALTDDQLNMYGGGKPDYVHAIKKLGPEGSRPKEKVVQILKTARKNHNISNHLSGKAVDISATQKHFNQPKSLHLAPRFGIYIFNTRQEASLHCVHCQLEKHTSGAHSHH